MTDIIKIRETFSECGGQGRVHICNKCHDEGTVPIIYTPAKWLAAGYELHDDLTVWWYASIYKKWLRAGWGEAKYNQQDKIIIATPAITLEVLEKLS